MNQDELIKLLHELRVGDYLEYTGELIVMRDAAQRRIQYIVSKSGRFSLNLEKKIVFYAGPAKKPKGMVVGAIGPTTSVRMDRYLEMLFKLGVMATVGKGNRSEKASQLCRIYGRVYFVAPSGSAAYLATRVSEFELLTFSDLGPEAIYRLHVENFPLLVFTDSKGKDFNPVL